MHMGHYAAMNIHQQMMAECSESKPTLKTLNPFPAVIGLALGTKAVSYTPDEGTKYGEELLTSLFGEDMGNSSKSIGPFFQSAVWFFWNPTNANSHLRLQELSEIVRGMPGVSSFCPDCSHSVKSTLACWALGYSVLLRV